MLPYLTVTCACSQAVEGGLRKASMQARAASSAENRFLARVAMSNLPRGGGDGDAIRMGILHIMRENGIKEGHRPVSRLV